MDVLTIVLHEIGKDARALSGHTAFGSLSRLVLSMPPKGPYSRYPDVSIVRLGWSA